MRRLLLAVLLAACESARPDFATPPTPSPRVDPDTLCAIEGATRCRGFDWQRCDGAAWLTEQVCSTDAPRCHDDRGCEPCFPGQDFCVGQEVYACEAGGPVSQGTCASTEACVQGACLDTCALAESTEAYLGCRFLAVPMANLVDDAFEDDFAVVVANPSDRAVANVVVSRRGQTARTEAVQPGETLAISLPMVPELRGFDASVRVPGGAYEIRSDVPLAAYQYNPLHFEAGDAYSFTNDASLLLPEHVLDDAYLVAAWPGLGVGDFPGEAFWLPGTVAIAAVQDDTLVTLRSRSETLDGTPAAMRPGETAVVSLDRGDVLQVFSPRPDALQTSDICAARFGERGGNGQDTSCLDRVLGDLTGMRLTANAPLAVWGGHVCTFVPHTARACDHLEEMLFPRVTLGRSAVMAAPTRPGGTGPAAARYRVISASDDNEITLTPAVHPFVVLGDGQSVGFETDEDFLVEATGPVIVQQVLLGQQALGTATGDPALGTGVPRQQWRSVYDFLVPETYTEHHLSLSAPAGTTVLLDGRPVEGWVAVPGTGYEVLRLEVTDGPHRVQSIGEVGFGLTTYGYAPYTSYLHPGGMNFLR